MPAGQSRLVDFEGRQQAFPADATDAEISAALGAIPRANADAAPKAKTWWDLHPTTANAVRGAVNALPGAGALAGGVIAAPAAAAASGTVAGIPAGLAIEAGGVGLGAGAGRGLRDLIAEGFGLEPTSSVGAKGARIALDTAEGTAAQAILPGLLTAIKTPGKTIGEVLDMLPPAMRPKLPSGLRSAPAPLLTRPASSAWTPYVAPETAPTVPRGTSTSMTPASMPTTGMPAGSPPIQPTVPGSMAEFAPADAPVAAPAKATSAPVAPAFTSKEEQRYFQQLIDRGMARDVAEKAVVNARALAARLKTPALADIETTFPKGMRGKS